MPMDAVICLFRRECRIYGRPLRRAAATATPPSAPGPAAAAITRWARGCPARPGPAPPQPPARGCAAATWRPRVGGRRRRAPRSRRRARGPGPRPCEEGEGARGFEGSVPGTACPESPRDGRGVAAGCGAPRYPVHGSARRGCPRRCGASRKFALWLLENKQTNLVKTCLLVSGFI